jgi:hypothetical protein
LEILKDLFVKEQNRVLTIIGSSHPIKLYSADSQGVYVPKPQENVPYYTSTENRLHALLFEKFDIKDKSIHEDISSIVVKRNKYIHPDRLGHSNVLSSFEVTGWFKTLEKIISKIE